jgi:hypothetical protein
MAGGHVNRANRPNTWLLRPTLQVKILLANPEPSATFAAVAQRRSVSGRTGHRRSL